MLPAPKILPVAILGWPIGLLWDAEELAPKIEPLLKVGLLMMTSKY